MRAAKLRLLAGTISLVLAFPGLALAQAWTPPKGDGFFTLNFQYVAGDNHLPSSSDSRPLSIGTMAGQGVAVDGDFGITDKLAVTTSLAYVSGRFTEGGHDETPPGSPHHGLPVDDGEWHGSLQDARVSLRYMQSKGHWVFTPVAAIVVPLRNYNTLGHGASGRGLNELQLELDVGRLFHVSGQPRVYAQGAYRYSFVENVGDVRPNRSNLLLELGYLAHRRLTLRGFLDWQDSHGGLEIPQDVHEHNFASHDRLAAARWLRLGVGLSIPVGPSINLLASVAHTVEGENTHDATSFSVGTSWGFKAPGSGRTKIRFPEPDD